MGKTSEAAVYRKYINSMKKKTKRMNEAANPAQQAAIAISMKKKGIKPKNLKEQISFAQMQQRILNANNQDEK
jgi:DNA-directed RNA polymerase subunit M/transcription elongation factor TFIIS